MKGTARDANAERREGRGNADLFGHPRLPRLSATTTHCAAAPETARTILSARTYSTALFIYCRPLPPRACLPLLRRFHRSPRAFHSDQRVNPGCLAAFQHHAGGASSLWLITFCSPTPQALSLAFPIRVGLVNATSRTLTRGIYNVLFSQTNGCIHSNSCGAYYQIHSELYSL